MKVVMVGDDRIVAWVADKMRDPQHFEKATSLAVVETDGPRLVAGVVFSGYGKGSVLASIAAIDKAWATRRVLRGLFNYPFEQLGCVRITSIVARGNKKSRKLAEKMGFKLEGTIRKGYDGKSDAMIYGLLREECKWLEVKNG